MSRSKKHTPYCGMKKDKFFKKYANRKLRRKKLNHDYQHNAYKKDMCSWDICDWYEIVTKNFEEYYKSCVQFWYESRTRWWMTDEHFPTKEQCWKQYQEWYIRK